MSQNLNSLSQEQCVNDPKELLHLLVQHATEYALMLLDSEARIIYWNEGAEKIFGYPEQEIIGQPVKTLFIPEDIELGVSTKEFERAREEGHSDDDRWHKRKDGTRFWATGVVTCFKKPSGEIVGFSKILRDQTARKNTEDEIKSTNADLTQFCYRASHDLSQPLRTIATFLQLIERKLSQKLEKEEKQLIEIPLKAAQQAQRLVVDILSYTEAGKRQSRFEQTDMEAVFDTAVSNLSRLIEESRAVVTRTSLPTLPAIPIQIVEVFQNLIANAIKYKGQDIPKIYAGASERSSDWVFEVCDNGIGIASENLEKIFEPFRRLQGQAEVPGSGLGLAIVKRIIERHGGELWAESNSGQGTTIRFTLPKHTH